jgi:hypothetical protein
MFRTLNATIFNTIANNPDIRPYLGGTQTLDLTSAVENPVNFCFLNDDKTGGHICTSMGNGVYDVHTLSLPEARGKNMLKLMQDCRAFMFLQTDCIELQTFVPDEAPQVNLWADLAGFRKEYWRPSCFNFKSKMIGGTFYSMTYRDWVVKDRANLKAGKVFHDQLEQLELKDHPDDEVHDSWAGAVVRAIGGNLGKAISYYNQWSARCSLTQFSILSFSPITVQMGSSILQLSNRIIYVLDKEIELSIDL